MTKTRMVVPMLNNKHCWKLDKVQELGAQGHAKLAGVFFRAACRLL